MRLKPIRRLAGHFHKRSRLRTSARMFIPTLGKRFIVIPFRIISVIPLVLLAIASGYFFLRSDIFLIKHINITYSGGIPGDEEFNDGLVGKEVVYDHVEREVIARSLWSVHPQQLEQKIVTSATVFKSVDVSRKLPDTILMQIKERTPVAQLIVDRQATITEPAQSITQDYYLLDSEGIVFTTVPRMVPLPRFSYQSWVESYENSSIQDAKLPDGVLDSVVETIEYISDQRLLAIEMYNMQDDYTLELITTDDVMIIISFDKSIQEQLEDAEAILKQLAASDKKVKKIDARFDKMFVEFR